VALIGILLLEVVGWAVFIVELDPTGGNHEDDYHENQASANKNSNEKLLQFRAC